MLPPRSVVLVGAFTALVAAAAPATAAPRSATAAVTVSVTTYDFKVSYPAIPAGSSTPVTRQCNVVGDLYVPSTASAAHPEPAILTTNGFGGSKADQAGIGTALGAKGYITLSYSGLGFGGSGCPITDDDPTSDGAVASQLVSFLGGQTGIAFTGFSSLGGWTGAVPAVTGVVHDTCNHAVPRPACGAADSYDPRVGMIGGSYGGEIQFSAAGRDPRIDTIVPLITWNDLAYSLDPGNTALTQTSLAPALPGVGKREWDNFFFGLGVTAVGGGNISSNTPNPQALGEPQPSSELTFGATDAMCPGFTPETCVADASTTANGYADATAQAFFTHSSVTNYMSSINVPVFLGQGEADTLFTLQEAATNYAALKARGIPVKMDWQSWGHSRLGAAPGEYPNTGQDPTTSLLQTYQGQQIGAWFDYYLKGQGPAPTLDFSYFRDYAYHNNGNIGSVNEAAAAAAYGHAASFPTGAVVRYDLSGTGALVPAGAPVTAGAATLTAIPGGASSVSIVDVVGATGGYTNPVSQPPPTDTPGTFAAWTSPPLAAATDVVGMPTLDVTVSSGQAQTFGDPASGLVLFAKLYDVAPGGGSVTLPERLIAPLRVTTLGAAGSTARLRITLPGIVHQFPAGDSLQVVLASGDQAYAGNNTPRTASFPTSAANPGVLSIPVVSTTSATSAAPTPAQPPTSAGPAPSAATGSLAFTGLNTLPLGIVGFAAVLLGAGPWVWRRRYRP